MTKDEIVQLVEAISDLKAKSDTRIDALAKAMHRHLRDLDDKIAKIDGVIVKFTTLKKDIEDELLAQKTALDELAVRVNKLEEK